MEDRSTLYLSQLGTTIFIREISSVRMYVVPLVTLYPHLLSNRTFQTDTKLQLHLLQLHMLQLHLLTYMWYSYIYTGSDHYI